MHTRISTASAMNWLVLAGTLVPLALVGCSSRQRAAGNLPTERVAGARQEEDTLNTVRQAGLPESFSFGGRAWKAHQIHWVEASDDGASAAGKQAGGFVPVADLMVMSHPIYRQDGVDEAMTDNIFLKAENLSAPAAGGQTTGGTNITRIAFVEYDATGTTVRDMELSAALTAAGLPQNITHGGKTWNAKEVQVYDADVFDEVEPLPQLISGHRALVDTDDKDILFVIADVETPAGDATASAEGTTAPPGATSVPGTVVSTSQTIFISYEMNK